MTRPTKHPKSGVYRVRMAIPAPLRDTAAALTGKRRELIENLGTKDPGEAKARAPDAIARLTAQLDAIRAHAAGQPASLTDRDVAALAGEAYRGMVDATGDDPGKAADWLLMLDVLDGQLDGEPDPDTGERDLTPSKADREEAARLLTARGYPADKATVDRLARAVFKARWQHALTMLRRARGDWRPDTTADRYPPPLPSPAEAAAKAAPEPAEAAPTVTFDALLAGFAADRGWGKVTDRPINRALYDRHRTLERLAAFLGHRDAAKVTKADAVTWKEDAQRRGSTAATIRNDVSEMSAIWRWGVANAKVAANPFQGVSPPKAKAKGRKVRPYTDAEAARVLQAARAETGALRWLPWLACLTGGRITELAQGDRADVVTVAGVRCLRIHEEEPERPGEVRSVKNPTSVRTVPLHPALLAEGFGAYVDALPAGSPLFPDCPPDKLFGSRGNTAIDRVGRWIKRRVGITDRTIRPNHSFRHWFEDAARGADIPKEVRDTLTGHVAETNAARGYGHGMGAFTTKLAAAVAKIAPPLPVPAAASPASDKAA